MRCSAFSIQPSQYQLRAVVHFYSSFLDVFRSPIHLFSENIFFVSHSLSHALANDCIFDVPTSATLPDMTAPVFV